MNSDFKAISVSEFIRKAKCARISNVIVTITYRVDMNTSKVCTLDFAVCTLDFFGLSNEGALNGIIGCDEDQSCWFDDGEAIYDTSGAFSFTGSDCRKGESFTKVEQFRALCRLLADNGFSITILAAGTAIIMEWIERIHNRGY